MVEIAHYSAAHTVTIINHVITLMGRALTDVKMDMTFTETKPAILVSKV